MARRYLVCGRGVVYGTMSLRRRAPPANERRAGARLDTVLRAGLARNDAGVSAPAIFHGGVPDGVKRTDPFFVTTFKLRDDVPESKLTSINKTQEQVYSIFQIRPPDGVSFPDDPFAETEVPEWFLALDRSPDVSVWGPTWLLDGWKKTYMPKIKARVGDGFGAWITAWQNKMKSSEGSVKIDYAFWTLLRHVGYLNWASPIPAGGAWSKYKAFFPRYEFDLEENPGSSGAAIELLAQVYAELLLVYSPDDDSGNEDFITLADLFNAIKSFFG